MNIIGLDVSLTSTGIALVEDGVFKDADTIRPGTAIGAARLVKMWEQIAEWCLMRIPRIGATIEQAVAPPYINLFAIEGYSYSSRATQAHSMGELGGVIRYELHKSGAPFVVIPPASWRKTVLGKGNLAKDQIRVEVFKRYNLELQSNDAVEAFCVAMAAYLQLTETPKPKIVRKKKVAA